MTPEEDRLISAYLTGDLDDEARAELESLLQENPEAGARLLELSQVDLLLEEKMPGVNADSAMVESEAGTQKVIAFPAKALRIKQTKQAQPVLLSSQTQSPRRWLALAALLIAGALAGVLFLLLEPSSIGQITAISGQVQLLRPHKAAMPAESGKMIRSGDVLETAADSLCTIRILGEATSLHLGAGAQLRLARNSQGEKNLRLDAGQLDADVAPQSAGQPLIINTRYAVATVLGTHLSIAESNQRTAIQVTSGEVRFADARRNVAVEVSHERMAVVGTDIPLQVVAVDTVHSVTDLLAPGDVLQGKRLLHDWAFEGTTEDQASALRTIDFGTVYTTGHRGKALDLSKSGGFTTGLVALPEQIELEFWTYLPPLPPVLEKGVSKRTIVCNSRSGYTDDGFRLMAYADGSDSGSLLLEAGDGHRGTSSRSLPGSLPPNQWIHAVVRIDRAMGKARFIIDDHDQTRPGDELHRDFGSLAPLTIGMMENGNYRLKGLLDELRIYSIAASRY